MLGRHGNKEESPMNLSPKIPPPGKYLHFSAGSKKGNSEAQEERKDGRGEAI